MNSETILKSDLLDILFDKRNKSYGAYILRKFYPNRIKTSLFIMFGIVTVLSAFTFLPESRPTPRCDFETKDVVLKQIADKKQEPVKPEQKKISSDLRSQVKLTPKIVIVPNEDSTDILQEIGKLAVGSNTAIFEEAPGGPGPAGEGPGGTQPQEPAEPVVSDNTPTYNPDIPPSFPGGDNELVRFLQKNLRSPRDMEEGELVEVKIKYVVDFDGNLQSFNIVKDGGEEFNSEVIRVLKKMPKWNPGKKGGQSVPVYYTIPVKFMSN